ncbi:FAD-dependent oxidoreductase [Agilicoccus flavus]|uniref:FAD-dependent oxidoreductase n=1 Tax=Agilicoccus flavus TaxID=2775968 RepID=UPI0027DA9D12|nr:FAD-dependent oxidoreductase [Agilicoccus flavus]
MSAAEPGARFPGRDPRAVRHPGAPGARRVEQDRHVAVVGGGIAGLAAAAGLAERGVRVTLLEALPQLGGRVAAWPVGQGDGSSSAPRTMSRGFHAFFRQYYNLRALLRRADPELSRLRPVPDYPLVRADGVRDSFAAIPRTPPWSLIGFVRQSPTFPLRALARVDLRAALDLVDVDYPASYPAYDGVSAQDVLDRLRFPQDARHLALEVFARSFFAHPSEFSGGELVAMFHTYFTGSAEGLLFDVPDDDYDTALWGPLGGYLAGLGVRTRTWSGVDHVDLTGERAAVHVSGERMEVDGVVLATDPRTTRRLVGEGAGLDAAWRDRVLAGRNAPPFAVSRLWLDRPVDPRREAFLGTAGYELLDNVTVLERFEAGAARWSDTHGGSVVELHGYALDPDRDPRVADHAWVAATLRDELAAVYPETAQAQTRHEELLVLDDCGLVGTSPWAERPGVRTPDPRLVLAGDAVRTDLPVALMERAATTGLEAANELLGGWGAAGHDRWSVPMRGLLRRLPGRGRRR